MPATPTTPKGLRTREQLLHAGRVVFARDGFVATRMSDVAREAGVSLGALYRYFEHKDDLFENVIGDIHEELYTASQPQTHHIATEPYEALLEANLGYLRHYYEHRDVMRALMEAANVDARFRDFWWAMRERHTQRFLHSLTRGPGDVVLDERDIPLGADAMACMVEQSAYVWYAHEQMHAREVDLDDAARVLTRAWYGLFFGAQPQA